MKKITFSFKSLLVACGLLLGSANAWADGAKRVLNSQNYETAETTDWTCTSGNATLITGDATYGKYAQCTPSGSGNRAISKSVTFSSDPSGYTTPAMTTYGYNIEFDFVLVGGNVVERSESVFRINTSGDPIFSLSQPQLAKAGANAGIAAGKAGTAVTTWYINDLTNATDETVTLDGSTWYHLKLVVTATSVAYTITNNSTSAEVKSGSKTIAAITKITGFGGQVGRGSGKLNFDNLEIYEYVDAEIVSNPSIADPVYAGADRTVTVTAGTSSKGNSVTTYYTTDGTAPSASNYAGSFTTSTKDVTITSNCTLKAITISSTSEQSSIVDKAVTVGKLTLNAPTFTKTAYSEGNYTVTIANDQSSLEYVPASTTIKYRVGTTGEYSTYSTGVSVPEGSTLYAYVEATNYTNSSTAECATTARTGMYQVWTQDYTQVSKAAGTGTQQINLNSSVDFTVGTRNFYNIVSYGTPPTAVSVTANVGLNTSSYFSFRCNGTSSGILKNSNSGGSNGYLGIRNLIPGQIIKISVNDTKLSAEAGAVLLEGLSTSKDYFFKASSTVASIFFPHGIYNYVYDVTVYNTKDIYNSLKTYATALAGVDNDNSAANSTLASVITAQNSAVESATTGAEISTALTTLRSAMDTYASVANPTIGNKFDLSYMLLNPNLENVKDWEAAEVYGWNTDYADNNFAVRTNLNSGKDGVERWRASAYTTPNTFAIYQEVTLPEGNYSFEAEALANQTSTMVMAAGDTEGDAITSPDFAAYSVDFTQASESEVKIGIKISSEGTNTCNWTGITSPRLYKEPASSVLATIGATGYTTFASSYPLDLTNLPDGLTAYYASAIDGENVTLTAKSDAAVAPGTGLVLKGDAGDYNIPVAASGAAIAGNLLVGCPTAGSAFGATKYVLWNDGGAKFCNLANYTDVAPMTIPAGKAYLDGSVYSVKVLNIVFGDETATGVDTPVVAEAEEDGVLYNTSGQQVTKDYKGIVIKNGKKYFNK